MCVCLSDLGGAKTSEKETDDRIKIEKRWKKFEKSLTTQRNKALADLEKSQHYSNQMHHYHHNPHGHHHMLRDHYLHSTQRMPSKMSVVDFEQEQMAHAEEASQKGGAGGGGGGAGAGNVESPVTDLNESSIGDEDSSFAVAAASAAAAAAAATTTTQGGKQNQTNEAATTTGAGAAAKGLQHPTNSTSSLSNLNYMQMMMDSTATGIVGGKVDEMAISYNTLETNPLQNVTNNTNNNNNNSNSSSNHMLLNQLVDELSTNQMMLESSQTSKSMEYGLSGNQQRRSRSQPKIKQHNLMLLPPHHSNNNNNSHMDTQLGTYNYSSHSKNVNTTTTANNNTISLNNRKLNNYWAAKSKLASNSSGKIQLTVSYFVFF